MRFSRLFRIKRGFLLIELLIALTIAALCAGVMAQVQAYAWKWHYNAQRILQATHIASQILDHVQQHGSLESHTNERDFIVKTVMWQPEQEIPFHLISVTVSWQTAQGTTQTCTLVGGAVMHA